MTLPAQWPAPFDKDLLKFKKAYQVGSDDASIQNAIMQHGRLIHGPDERVLMQSASTALAKKVANRFGSRLILGTETGE